MERKLFAGLLAGMLICLAFVLTNASSTMVVSGTVEMYRDGSSQLEPASDALIQVFESSSSSSPYITTSADGLGEFSITNVKKNSVIHYSYSDDWGATNTEKRQYSSDSRNEHIRLHYTSH